MIIGFDDLHLLLNLPDDLLDLFLSDLHHDDKPGNVVYLGTGNRETLNVDVSFENSVLTIKSVKDKDEEEVKDNDGVLHKGIAKRMFTKSFTIAEDVEIKGAELKDGLLVVSMERIIPEHKKARTIKIK